MQQTGPTLIDESIMDVPIPCRVIGTINMLFCSFSVVSLLMYTLIILYNCRVCEHSDVSCRNMCEIDTKHKIGSSILLIFWMYMFLIIAFFIKIIVVNNGLRSFDLPTGGKKMELWVHYHKIFLIICLLSITFLGMKNMIGYNFYLFYYGISTIALIIELIVIGKFNKEYMISTDRYNSDVWYLNI